MTPDLATFLALFILLTLFAGIVAHHVGAVRRYERGSP